MNHTDTGINYGVSSSFRFANDADNGGVEIVHPESVFVPAGGDAKFKVTLKLRGLNLRDWGMNSGSLGNNGDALSFFEYDGYVQLSDTGNSDLTFSNVLVPVNVTAKFPFAVVQME